MLQRVPIHQKCSICTWCLYVGSPCRRRNKMVIFASKSWRDIFTFVLWHKPSWIFLILDSCFNKKRIVLQYAQKVFCLERLNDIIASIVHIASSHNATFQEKNLCSLWHLFPTVFLNTMCNFFHAWLQMHYLQFCKLGKVDFCILSEVFDSYSHV